MGIQNRPSALWKNSTVTVSLLLLSLPSIHTFTIPPNNNHPYTPTNLPAKKQSRTKFTTPSTTDTPDDEGEVFGTKFFGGSAVKEELFDAELEEQAERLQRLYPRQKKKKKQRSTVSLPDVEEEALTYRRFEDGDAFPDGEGRELAERLQSAINQALYETDEGANTDDLTSLYSKNMSGEEWITPFLNGAKVNGNKDGNAGGRSDGGVTPLEGLGNALEYYKRVDVAIVSARTTQPRDAATGRATLDLRWEISVLWPNAFESQVLVSGVSTLVTSTNDADNGGSGKPTIVSQRDQLDSSGIAKQSNDDGPLQSIVTSVAAQLTPRFWDLYHIGMTPSAELMPRVNTKTGGDLFAPLGLGLEYKLFEIPPRLVLKPTMVDVGGRTARGAEAVPNHAFTTVIKTTGRSGQRYVPASPLEVAIRRRPRSEVYPDEQTTATDNENENDPNAKQPTVSVIEWSVPLPPEFISYDKDLPLPSLTPEDLSSEFDSYPSYTAHAPTCNYVYRPHRRVATVAYGGSPQDSEVADIRRKLYERVVQKDGLRPKLDVDGRPVFFFLQNNAKVCFTADGGLGMVVYDWRPEGVGTNEVGIELEMD